MGNQTVTLNDYKNILNSQLVSIESQIYKLSEQRIAILNQLSVLDNINTSLPKEPDNNSDNNSDIKPK